MALGSTLLEDDFEFFDFTELNVCLLERYGKWDAGVHFSLYQN
jgi:hypothetical protein